MMVTMMRTLVKWMSTTMMIELTITTKSRRHVIEGHGADAMLMSCKKKEVLKTMLMAFEFKSIRTKRKWSKDFVMMKNQ